MSLHHAEVVSLSDSEIASLIDWVETGSSSRAVVKLLTRCTPKRKPLWVLAHCDDGVTWGRLDEGALALSSSAVAEPSTPVPGRRNLQQLRAFGGSGEILLWRLEGSRTAPFRGRLLLDDGSAGAEDPTAPMDEIYLLSADRALDPFVSREGFTAVRDRGGRTQVVPLAVGSGDFGGGAYCLGLEVRHYFATEPRSGCVRMAASRLAGLRHLGKERRLHQAGG